MTKNPTPTEKSKQERDNTKTPPNFDYTTIADRLRTVSLGNETIKIITQTCKAEKRFININIL